MLSRELEVTLNFAFKDARRKKHELISVEHLLFALLENASATEVLRACGANLDELKESRLGKLGSISMFKSTSLIPIEGS